MMRHDCIWFEENAAATGRFTSGVDIGCEKDGSDEVSDNKNSELSIGQECVLLIEK
ncbi:MAG: hypothetical protein WC623_22390 [Pedobacter sp.]